MSVAIRPDFQSVIFAAIEAKQAKIRRTTRADAKHDANRAPQSWEAYSAKYGKGLEILARAEAAENQADADRSAAQSAIETAQGIQLRDQRETALTAARAALADARRRSAAASDVVSTLRNKLGGDVVTDFSIFEANLWAKVDAADARLATLQAIYDKVLTRGVDKITDEDAQRWYTLEPMPLLLESTRQRELLRATGARPSDVKITDDELAALDAFDA